MSWNAYLIDDRGHDEGAWNYTHNCNGMANDALDLSGIERPADTARCKWLNRDTGEWVDAPEGHGNLSWWKILDGMSGPEGASLLHAIITEMAGDPARYRAMNPENGWGDYASFLSILTDMRNAVPEWPTTWKVYG